MAQPVVVALVCSTLVFIHFGLIPPENHRFHVSRGAVVPIAPPPGYNSEYFKPVISVPQTGGEVRIDFQGTCFCLVI